MKHMIKREATFHITKRTNLAQWKAWLIRGGAVIIAFLCSGIFAAIVTKGEVFQDFYAQMFYGTFGTKINFLDLLNNWAILLCIALALTPAFKMKFWNIGAEGQTLMGCLMAGVVIHYCEKKVPNEAIIIIALLVAVVAGAVWGLIPALFKAKWNTNETLFTLMLNYIASYIVMYTVNSWLTTDSGTKGSTSLGIFKYGTFSSILPKGASQNVYIINAVIVLITVAISFVYLKFSKHGYEIDVVGGSVNTARYIGINVKKVIIRTMIISGAVCGLAGFLIVCGGASPTLNENLVGGRGFTGILVAWLSQFNPLIMMCVTFLVVFMQNGSAYAASQYNSIGAQGAFKNLTIGIFFLLVIASEFFVNYKIVFYRKGEKKKNSTTGSEALDITEKQHAADIKTISAEEK